MEVAVGKFWQTGKMELHAQPEKTNARLFAIGAVAATVALVPPLAVAIRGGIRPSNRKRKGLLNFPTIVVLGTAQYDGIPSRQFAARLQWAAQLWADNRQQDVVTLGGKLPGDRYTEAEVGREYLLTTHVDTDLLHMVEEGNDTLGSFTALKKKIDSGALRVAEPFLIVTDPNHALRAELIARQVGFDAWSSATPHTPTTFPSRKWWRSLVHETGGLIVVGVRQVAGSQLASTLESALRDVQAAVIPSRKARHDVLKEQKET